MSKLQTTQKRHWQALAFASVAVLALGACGFAPGAEPGYSLDHLQPISLTAGEKLKVVATTSIVGDVVRNVGGNRIDLTVLMGIGVDPHSYVPTPADTVAIHDAYLVFANGAGLEADLEEMIGNAGGQAIHVDLSDGLELLPLAAHPDEAEGEEHDHGEADPHVWFSVHNVIRWVESIDHALSQLDPSNAQVYEENADEYVRELEALDTWIRAQMAEIPEANRKLVTNHPAFGYLASSYGLVQVGAVYPVSPSAEPSARDIAALQDAIRQFGVQAVFTESTANPQLAEQVARDTGVKLVPLYTGSLSGPGGGAETYIELMRFDVAAIVEALR